MPKHAKNDPAGTPSDRAFREDASFDEQPLEADAVADESAPVDDDDHIGLTEAFAPVDDDDAVREARAAGDDHIGLTEAFAPVGEGAHAGGFSYKGDTEDEYPDALESLEPQNLPPLLAQDDSVSRDSAEERVQGRHGKEDAIPAYQHKSRRLRRTLIVIIIVLAALLVAAVVAGGMLLHTASQTAMQMAASTQQESEGLQDGVDDASMEAEKLIEAPDLSALIGMTQDQAIEAVGRGATVTATQAVNEEGNPIRSTATVALTDEPADTRSGTPTVYLGFDEGGAIIQAGYSAPTSSLGYGSLSFADAVSNEHVIEQTLREAGVPVEDGTVTLPEDKSTYSTYDSDGTTLVRENCTFEGEVAIGDVPRSWSATLSYDYTTANATDNLADTIRIIYIYLNA